jgi:hypothetical protein
MKPGVVNSCVSQETKQTYLDALLFKGARQNTKALIADYQL